MTDILLYNLRVSQVKREEEGKGFSDTGNVIKKVEEGSYHMVLMTKTSFGSLEYRLRVRARRGEL